MSAALKAALSVRSGQNRHGMPVDVFDADLVQFVSDSGFVVAVVPNEVRVATAILEGAELLVLAGGPEAVRHPGQAAQGRRQATEAALLDMAIARGIPVLGICRGMQVINCHFGGMLKALTQDHTHAGTEHVVRFRPSWLATTLAVDSPPVVNSYHDIGIATTAPDMRVVAIADDGEIEAIEHSSLDVCGVMWHPERPMSDSVFARAHRNLLLHLSGQLRLSA